jgi:hypothetical protein
MNNPERCQAQIRDRGRFMLHWHRCTRKATRDGYCTQHHPDTVEQRRAAMERRWNEKRKRDPIYVIASLRATQSRLVRLLRQIQVRSIPRDLVAQIEKELKKL